MPATYDALTALAESTIRGTSSLPVLKPETHSVSWDMSLLQGKIVLQMSAYEDHIRLTCSSSENLTARTLRAMLVGDALLISEPVEHHLLETFSPQAADLLDRMQHSLRCWAAEIEERAEKIRRTHRGDRDPEDSVAQGIWYDREANFGDAAGPWLVAQRTGRQIVNVRRTKETPTRAQGRAALLVGSIIQMFNRDDVDIWGSGLMSPLTQEQSSRLSERRGIEVHAVRGLLTAEELREKISWEVPAIYGDPALLLPRYLPVPEKQSHICVVPHLQHRAQLTERAEPGLHIADVREDVASVVRQIASAQACISTSLHGIIVAQAYGVPWVWLDVVDSPLGGGRFKFNDFFTTLDSSAVSHAEILAEDLPAADFRTLAESARLPALQADLDALDAAMPIPTGRAQK